MNVTELKAQVRAWLVAKQEGGTPITEIARELNISYFWVQRFIKGELDNPRSDRLQYLVGRMQGEQGYLAEPKPPQGERGYQTLTRVIRQRFKGLSN